MTDQELADTLKARISAWQGYMEQTQSRSSSKPAEESLVEGSVVTEMPVSETNPLVFAEPVPVSDSLIERYEEQIADLRAALEHERYQARCLAETLAREQALRACASPAVQNSEPVGNSHHPRDRYRVVEREMRSQVLWAFVLLAGIVCCLFYFLR